MKYNRDQWRDPFEGQLSLLRPHFTRRVLAAMSHVAWTEDGTKDKDPVKTAMAWSVELDKTK